MCKKYNNQMYHVQAYHGVIFYICVLFLFLLYIRGIVLAYWKGVHRNVYYNNNHRYGCIRFDPRTPVSTNYIKICK